MPDKKIYSYFLKTLAAFFIPSIYYLTTNNFFMGGFLYLIAVILVIAWAIGFLGYHAGGLIHILLVIAVIALLLKIIRKAE